MSYLITTNKLEDYTFTFENFFIKSDSEFDDIYITEDEFILIEGFIFDLNLDSKLSPKEALNLVKKYRATNTVFPENITGQYNIVYLSDHKIDIINDFVGMKALYYHFGEMIYISNNIYSLKEFDFEIDSIGLFQSMLPGLYIPLNCRSLLQNVSSLRNGEYIQYDIFTKNTTICIDSMNMQNKSISGKGVEDMVELLQKNGTIYNKLFKKKVLPISAGVDTRITLSSFTNLDDSFSLISYGEKDYIDNKIAKQLANFIGIPHKNVSFKNHLFPTNLQFNNIIKNGGDYFVSSWFSILNELNNSDKHRGSVVLIGDVLDTLRAKNVKFLRGRKDRIKYQLKSFIGKEIKLPPLNIELYSLNQKTIYKSRINELYEAFPDVLDRLSFDKETFIKETEIDLDLFIEYTVKKFQPKNQANLEEAFYVCTWGAKTMAKQINVFKGAYQNYVLMASRHVVKHNLNYSTLDRFEDKLTHKMLLNKGFNKYSHFPTSQIPFVAYSKNIYIKYIFWAFRSFFDQISIKFGKGRLVKHIEWAQYYKNPENKVLLENLLSEVSDELKKMPLGVFDNRASGKSWPLSEVDINMYCYLLKVNYLK